MVTGGRWRDVRDELEREVRCTQKGEEATMRGWFRLEAGGVSCGGSGGSCSADACSPTAPSLRPAP